MSEEAELYARLFPYILRDFSTHNDIVTLLTLNFLNNKLIFYDIKPESSIDIANYYKSLIENGEDLTEKIKPVIEL